MPTTREEFKKQKSLIQFSDVGDVVAAAVIIIWMGVALASLKEASFSIKRGRAACGKPILEQFETLSLLSSLSSSLHLRFGLEEKEEGRDHNAPLMHLTW